MKSKYRTLDSQHYCQATMNLSQKDIVSVKSELDLQINRKSSASKRSISLATMNGQGFKHRIKLACSDFSDRNIFIYNEKSSKKGRRRYIYL